MNVLNNIKRGFSNFFKRSFKAARKISVFQNYSFSYENINVQVLRDNFRVREIARELEQNNDYVKGYIRTMKVNIIGDSGFVLQVKGKDSSSKAYKADNRFLENKFYDWCKKENCSTNGKLSFTRLCFLVFTGLIRDGECFIQIVWDNSKYGMTLNVIEPENIDEGYNYDFPDGRKIVMGVEIDSTGKPLNYYVKNVNSNKHFVVPAQNMIHIFDQLRSNQVRGVSWLVQSMLNIAHLGDYIEACLINAKTAACNMGIISDNTPAFGASIEDANNVNLDTEIQVDPGSFVDIGRKSFTAYNPNFPTNMHDSYVKSILKGIAMGLGISYITLANDLSETNFASGHIGLMAEREFFKMCQGIFIDGFLRDVYKAWLLRANLTKDFQGKQFNLDVFSEHEWVGRRWQAVDKLKDVKADITAISSGLKTWTQALAERGIDADELAEELKVDKERFEGSGLWDFIVEPVNIKKNNK